MSATLLDFSRRPDLGLHAQIVGDVAEVARSLGLAPLIIGAFARDLHLLYGHGIETSRKTEDLDFAVAVPDWGAFEALRRRLVASARFSSTAAAPHRLRHRNGWPIDLVPFGLIETRERKIIWPPSGEFVMDAFGFGEAQTSACEVIFPSGVHGRVVSLPALTVLKLVCWHERHYAAPRKDAHDLLLIAKNYLQAGNEARLFDEFSDWTQEDTFDYQLASARMLGHDARALLDGEGLERVGRLLTEQVDGRTPARLPYEMAPDDPDRARALLEAILRGLTERR